MKKENKQTNKKVDSGDGWKEVDERVDKMIEHSDPRRGMGGVQKFCPKCGKIYVMVEDGYEKDKKISFYCPSKCGTVIGMKVSKGYWGVFRVQNIGGKGLARSRSAIDISDSSNLRKRRGMLDDIEVYEKQKEEIRKREEKNRKEREEYEEEHKEEISIERTILGLLKDKKISLEKKKIEESVKIACKELEAKGVNLAASDVEYIIKALRSSVLKNLDEF